MRVGPLPSKWVVEWAIDASESMRQASSDAVTMPFKVGRDFFDSSRAMVLEWVEVARAGDVFTWEGEVHPDAMRTMLQYWRNLAQVRHDLLARGEARPMHADAERFTQALRRAILDGLVAEGCMTVEHAVRMEATWPTLSAPGSAPAPARVGGVRSAAGDGDVAQNERDAGGAAR